MPPAKPDHAAASCHTLLLSTAQITNLLLLQIYTQYAAQLNSRTHHFPRYPKDTAFHYYPSFWSSSQKQSCYQGQWPEPYVQNHGGDSAGYYRPTETAAPRELYAVPEVLPLAYKNVTGGHYSGGADCDHEDGARALGHTPHYGSDTDSAGYNWPTETVAQQDQYAALEVLPLARNTATEDPHTYCHTAQPGCQAGCDDEGGAALSERTTHDSCDTARDFPLKVTLRRPVQRSKPPADSYVIGGITRAPDTRQSPASVDDFYLLPSTPATNMAEAVPVPAEWEEEAAPLELGDRNTLSNSYYGELPDLQSSDGDDERDTSPFADTNLFACSLTPSCPASTWISLSAPAPPWSYEVVSSEFVAISKAVRRPAPHAKAAKPSHTRRFLHAPARRRPRRKSKAQAPRIRHFHHIPKPSDVWNLRDQTHCPSSSGHTSLSSRSSSTYPRPVNQLCGKFSGSPEDDDSDVQPEALTPTAQYWSSPINTTTLQDLDWLEESVAFFHITKTIHNVAEAHVFWCHYPCFGKAPSTFLNRQASKGLPSVPPG